ncbi:PREDICTED: wall-associated receptor kinase-like 20 [Ipomoea nil]|uniref:wall-associated receptor kinase-like 20 n=1 Tax=Ipomoea nil TaxID=35883 RepID=UPI000901C183|nr:PREDICTED: wall-associated receptor kinase-like 20 [Ipomoea nil]
MTKHKLDKKNLCASLLLLVHLFQYSSSQKSCPECGSMRVPYPLSTNPTCGNTQYSIRCDPHSQELYFDALNGSSYLILKIMAPFQRMVVQPSPWVSSASCVTQDMPKSEGLWLNQSLPFSVTTSNTVFLFNCSPRLMVSPLNCTPSSLCHRYLEKVDAARSQQCASGLRPCCTFVAGGMPSAYKIRLHSSGCRAFRSILHLNPTGKWEEGLEIQWIPPSEPSCTSQADCSGASTCLPAGKNGVFRCFCNTGNFWNHSSGVCMVKENSPHHAHSNSNLALKVLIGVGSFFVVTVLVMAAAISVKRFSNNKQVKLAKARKQMLMKSSSNGACRMFSLKQVKKATNGFSKDRMLGSGGFGEVYKAKLEDGSIVAIKSAKVGNLRSMQQVLNEVGILSQVNHRNLVRLLGCCVEAEQPLLIYEYICNGTLHDHIHGKFPNFMDWKTRLKVAFQTAQALAYLHSAVYTPIYHRDVKSTNILLDREFNAKVSDFGLSRLARPGLSHVSTCAQGTMGYLDPEYYRNYQLTDKSDVYSFGVVLLELLTSQRAIDFSRGEDEVNLAVYVLERAKSGSIMEVVDKRLYEEEEAPSTVKAFAELAVACLREKKGDRPGMKDVTQQLQCIAEAVVDQEEASCVE